MYHYQQCIQFHSPYSSDVVPDSTIQSDSDVGPDYNANESDESELAAECSGHQNHKTVAYLAPSKMQALNDLTNQLSNIQFLILSNLVILSYLGSF